MAKRKIRLTKQGFTFLLIVVGVIIIAVVAILWVTSCNDGCAPSEAAATATPTATAVASVTPSADPFAYTSASAPAISTPNPTDTEGENPVSATSNPTAAAATTAPNILTEPTSEMKNNAKDGKTDGSTTNMRKGPSTDYDIVGTYQKGEALVIYTESNGWYFVKITKDGKYGYIRKDLIELSSATQPTGTVKGTVTGSIIAFRKGPSTDSQAIGQYSQGQIVYIHYKEGDFYYVSIPDTDLKGYMYAEYVRPSASVPDKP